MTDTGPLTEIVRKRTLLAGFYTFKNLSFVVEYGINNLRRRNDCAELV